MQFTKRLRDGVRSGDVTCSVRIWTRPHVKPGGRYPMEEGQIEVDSIAAIELHDVTPALARASGFDGVVDLLKTAKHGRGTDVYLVRFHYVPPQGEGASKRRAGSPTRPRGSAKTAGGRQRTRVVRIVEQLPEAKVVASGTHLSLEVRKKRFGYFLDNHRGDGRLALHCKSAPDVADALLQLAPEQVHTPKYVGNKGWIGLWLDGAEVHWEAVEIAIQEAYALVAPKSLGGLGAQGKRP